MSNLNDLIVSQDALLREAALALPHEFSRCTFNMGPIRQAVYLCLTCATPRGICSSCSIACHTDHEQIELFPKRDFRCDCPTTAIPHTCTLNKNTEDENGTNRYGQNFKGLFCRCARPYDPTTELETMIQCLACEDWFHESCLNLREKPTLCEPSADCHDPDEMAPYEDDCSDASSVLPPPLISADDYESLVCAACVSKTPILRRYAGTKGAIMVVRVEEEGPWTRLDGEPPGQNRGCSSETPLDVADPEIYDSGTGDIFLTEGFRQRWCRCENCLPSLQAHPYLLEEEETYEPPEDPDSGLSFEELGARALERLPRDRAIDGIHAFNNMRDRFLEYLRPFAQQGKIVEEADVTRFFEALKEKRQSVN